MTCLSPVLNGQHSQSIFSGSMESLDASGTVAGACAPPNREGRMTYILFILAMGPMSSTGIYNPQVTHHGRCIVEPGTFDALYCPAPAAPAHLPHGKKR